MKVKQATISKKVTGGEDLIVLPRHSYEQLQQNLEEMADALGKIERGEREIKAGKTQSVKSLAELRK